MGYIEKRLDREIVETKFAFETPNNRKIYLKALATFELVCLLKLYSDLPQAEQPQPFKPNRIP